MKERWFGNTGIKIPAIGLGCMGMSYAYGTKDNLESIATLRRSLDLGSTHWDTADLYGNGENERLLASVLKTERDKVFLATKVGFRFREDADMDRPYGSIFNDGSAEHIRRAVPLCLERLGVDYVDLLYLHRVDPKVPIEESVLAMAEFVKAGKVRHLGLSECKAEDLIRANAVWPIAAVQSEYSVLSRDAEAEVLPLTKKLGIAFVAFAPIARGLLSNTLDLSTLSANDFRAGLPRYSEEHRNNNQSLAHEFAAYAKQKGVAPSQLAIAWVLGRSDHIVAIPGTKRRIYLEENVKAADIVLTAQDYAEMEEIVKRHPNVGERYSTRETKFLPKK